MAASSSSPTIEDYQCPSCLTQFNTTTRLPVILDACNHTICTECSIACETYIGVNDDHEVYACPICSTTTKRSWDKTLQTNETIKQLAEHHILAPIPGRCERHPSVVTEFVCVYEECNHEVVCGDCRKVPLHRNHNFEPLDVIYKKDRDELENLRNETATHIPKLQQQLEKIAALLPGHTERFNTKRERFIREYDSDTESFITAFKQQRTLCKESILHTKKALNSVDHSYDGHVLDVQKLQTAVTQASQLLQDDDPRVLVNEFEHTKRKLNHRGVDVVLQLSNRILGEPPPHFCHCTWKIKNFTKYAAAGVGIVSRPLYSDHHSWILECNPGALRSHSKPHSPHIAMRLRLTGTGELQVGKSWSITHQIHLRLVNHEDYTRSITIKQNSTFHSGSSDVFWPTFARVEDVVAPTSGFLVNDTLTFELSFFH